MATLIALLLGWQVLVAPAVAPVPLPQLFDQALSASRQGRFDEALPLWNQVLEVAPGDAAAWSNRGNVQLALGDPRAAIADQTRAMELDAVSPDPHLNRGTAEEALGQWAAAEADYRWILERAPQDAGEPRASALYNLGNVQGSLGDWASARSSFEAASLARPGFAMARSSAATPCLPMPVPRSRLCCGRRGPAVRRRATGPQPPASIRATASKNGCDRRGAGPPSRWKLWRNSWPCLPEHGFLNPAT